MKRGSIIAVSLGAVVLIGVVQPFGAPGAARAAAPLSALVLHKGDVPAGFKLTKSKSDTIQAAAKSSKVSVATMRAKGWAGSYTTSFEKIGKGTATDIESGVDNFKTVSGAKWDLAHGIQQLKQQYPQAKTLTVNGLGDQAIGITVSGKSGKVRYGLVFIVFRRGHYMGGAGVAVGGTPTLPSVSSVMGYATTVDNHVKSSG